MRPSRETLERLQDQWAFGSGALEIVIRLGELLRQITEDKYLASCLMLKGGTALNLCFGPPARLSVDLDFNYVGAEDRATMLEQKPAVLSALARIAGRTDYRVQKSREERAGQKIYLGFRSAFGNDAQLKVDINFLHRLPLLESSNRELWTPSGHGLLDIPVVSIPELAVGKLLAALDRVAPRDLFDVVTLPERTGLLLDDPTFRGIFIALSGTLNHALCDYGPGRFDRVTDKTVAANLQPLLRIDDRPLAEDLKARAWEVIEPLLQLSQAERQYSELIQRGEFRPQLLFPNQSELADRVRRHPALLWKVKNARRHHSGRRRDRDSS